MKSKLTPCHPFGNGQLHGTDAHGAMPHLNERAACNCGCKRNRSVECRVTVALNAIAQAIGGPAVERPANEPTASPALHLPRADLMLVGTALARPFVIDEAQELTDITGDSVAIIRVGQDDHSDRPFTVDILMAHTEHWVSLYIPWQIHMSSELWFVPSQGEGRSFRVLPAGFLVSPRAPFSSLYEREYGFGLAMRSITNMMGAR